MASQLSSLQSYLSSRFQRGVNTDLSKDQEYQKFVSKLPIDVNSVKDVPTLNNALKMGQINKNQYMQRLQQFTGQSNPTGPTQVSILHPSTLIPGVKAYGPSVVNQQDIQPVKNNLVGAYQKARSQASYLSGPTSTQAQRSTIINNQKAAQSSPAVTTAINKSAVTPKGPSQGNSAAGLIKAEQMAKQGQPPKTIQAFLAKDRQALATQTGKGINAAATITSFSVPGQGILAKGLGAAADKTGVIAALGKDEATNALINSQKAANATKAATVADKLGSSSVKEAKTQRIPVISPTETTSARQAVGTTAIKNADRTSIPVEGKSTQVTGKVTTNPDSKYTAASNKLSKQYEKDLAKVQSVPHPVTQQVLQRQLDQKYTGLQNELDNKFGQTSVSFTGKPKTLGEATTQAKLPRSALDNQATPLESQTSPVTGVADKTVQTTTKVPKESTVPSTKPTVQSIPNTGPKIAGSALNSEQRAVEKGLVTDLGEKATYKGGSYKQEASKAVSLVNEKPEEAMRIATGEKAGDNTIHEVAVRRAVENKALQNGDVHTLTRLANSTQHTTTSEAAQRLGAEGFSADRNSPVQAIREISQARAKAALGKGEKAGRAVSSTVKDIQKTVEPKMKVSRQDWHSFIKDLQCK